MTDKELIERLRENAWYAKIPDTGLIRKSHPMKAANRLEALSAENARLREALEDMTKLIDEMSEAAFVTGLAGTSDWDRVAGGTSMFTRQDAARAALKGGE